MLIGFLFRSGLDQWSYAIAADIAAQGVDFIRFTPENVDFSRRLVHGEYWRDGEWRWRWSRFPDAVRNFEFKDPARDMILDFVPYSLGRRLRKNDQLYLLERHPGVARYLPKTIDIKVGVDLVALLADWGTAVLKPARGRLGQGVIFVRHFTEGYEIESSAETRHLSLDEGRAYLADFERNVNRDYVVQQFAACTGPVGRYFNVRVILHKSADGDWHPCNFPLSLLAKPGTVVANRDLGATNVHLRTVLEQRFGADTDGMLTGLFTVAVSIARILDDALAQRVDELALDMAFDEKGNPWLHEANWRGGFWFLEEDVGLYRFGGANIVRLARRHRHGANPDRAAAAQVATQARKCCQPGRLCDGVWRPLAAPVAVEIVLRSDDTALLTVRLAEAGLECLAVSTLASFGAAREAIGSGLAALREQAPGFALPRILVSGGYCHYDPKDERTPRTWMHDVLLDASIVDMEDLSIGTSLSGAYLRREIDESRRDLGLQTLDTFFIEGLAWQIKQRVKWRARWREAVRAMVQAVEDGAILAWGFALPIDLFMTDVALFEYLITMAGDVDGTGARVLVLELDPLKVTDLDLGHLRRRLLDTHLNCVLRLAQGSVVPKYWNQSHCQLPADVARALIDALRDCDVAVSCPVANLRELDLFFNSFSADSYGREIAMIEKNMPFKKPLPEAVVTALRTFAQFDQRQWFRFFVDGRFHKKYRGWRGYEENELGSVMGMLNAYTLVFENFNISGGLTSNYIRALHGACMSNVSTKNRKSTPGELRHLESGINLFRSNSTLASVTELLDQRRGDGNWIFHTDKYRRPTESFMPEEILQILKQEGRLRYRLWYPNLSEQQQKDLNEPRNLVDYYRVKHYIQMCFAQRTDAIVERYNVEIATANDDRQRLVAISRVVRDLELLHPFPDGNGRTFVALLMNHLLLVNGFLPAILWDPNIDAELSVSEFAEEIARGIENTLVLLADPTAILYGYSIQEASEEEIRTFFRMSRNLTATLFTLAYGDSDHGEHSDQLYLHLTPWRLAAASGGVWFNVDADRLGTLRFQRVCVTPEKVPGQLWFCRNVEDWKSAGKSPQSQIAAAVKDGVTAVVINDRELARSAGIPAYWVPDVDDALYDAASAVRASVACRAVVVLGSADQSPMKDLLARMARSSLRVHTESYAEWKTPQVMASLANLRLDYQLEIIEVATGVRPNVARHRLRAIAPDICVYASCRKDPAVNDKIYGDVVGTLAACIDGLRPGGLCILNSASEGHDRLVGEIRARSGDVAIQTFGLREQDQARLCTMNYDLSAGFWLIESDILGSRIGYRLMASDDDTEAPLLSVGALLALLNLGCDDLSEAVGTLLDAEG